MCWADHNEGLEYLGICRRASDWLNWSQDAYTQCGAGSVGFPAVPRQTLTCTIVCINICTHVKNPKHWQPYHCLDTLWKILHTLIEMGSAALAAAVPYPGNAGRTRISPRCKGQRNIYLKKLNEAKKKKKLSGTHARTHWDRQTHTKTDRHQTVTHVHTDTKL